LPFGRFTFLPFLIVLHRTTVQTAVLLDDGTAIDAYDFSVGESQLDDAHGFSVQVRLFVGGHQNSTVYH
jgi:hypothetical protein